MESEKIPFDYFKKVDLRTAKILSAERIAGSEKLLKLKIDLGSETRQLVAGIGKRYEPENLIGREIVIVTNLESRMLMSEESQGMLLAAHDENGPVIIIPEQKVLPGTIIS